MSEQQSRSAGDYLQLAVSALGAVGAIVIAAKNLSTGVQDLQNQLRDPAHAIWWLGALVLAFVAAALARRVLNPKPQLLKQGAFHVQRDRVDHLKGREEDIKHLLSLCSAETQVHLVGESGSGKSALILCGLMPRLASENLIGVYVNAWGRDWVDGPRNALRLAIERTRDLDAGDLEAALAVAQARRMRLLLIFDQFDDYQNAHVHRFRSAKDRSFISASELAAANPFWSEIRDLIVKERLHCLFATRSDTAAGLESVRFVQARSYTLDRLRREDVLELIDTLLESPKDKPAISAAENGWPALRDRLLRDLAAAEGSILPIQMKFALEGLATLRYLTVREYERNGGLEGIEAAQIARHVRNTARHAGAKDGQVLAMLRAMVDRDARKTCSRSVEELAAASGLDAAKVTDILDEWKTKELVRDTGERTWSLDHDYLSNGVLAAEKRANRAFHLLSDAEDDFRASGRNLWRRWQTMLTPGEQVGLWVARVRKQFRYGVRRSFAAVSLLRFAPYAAVVAIAALIAWNNVETKRDHAAQLVFDNLPATNGPDKHRSLLALSAMPRRRRIRLVQHALEGTDVSQKLRDPQVLHALVGLDDWTRKLTADVLADHLLDTRDNKEIVLSASRAIAALDGIDWQLLERSQRVPGRFEVISSEMTSRNWKRLLAEQPEARADAVAAYVLATPSIGSFAWNHLLPHLSEKFCNRTDKKRLVFRSNVPNLTRTSLKPYQARLAGFEEEKPEPTVWTFEDVDKVIAEKGYVEVDDVIRFADKMAPGEAAKLAIYANRLNLEEITKLNAGLPAPLSARFGIAKRQYELLVTSSLSTLTGAATVLTSAGGVGTSAFVAAIVNAAKHLPHARPGEGDAYLENLADAAKRVNEIHGDATPIIEMMTADVKAALASTDEDHVTDAVAEAFALVSLQLSGEERDRYRRTFEQKLLATGKDQLAARYANMLIALGDTQWLASGDGARQLEIFLSRPFLSSLSEVLLPIASQLTPSTQAALAASFVGSRTDPDVLVLFRRVPPERLREAAWKLVDKGDPKEAGLAAVALLVTDPKPQTLVDVLKKPDCVEACERDVLELAESNFGVKSDGDLWTLVAWARKQGLDLRSP
jgi:hypothetical protein